MIKKKFTLKGSIILIILMLISNIAFSKVRVNVDGTININIGKKGSGSSGNTSTGIWDNDDKYTNVGDITDRQYNMQPFLINGKGYAVIRDRGNLYILQVTFYNGNLNKVDREVIYNAKVFSSNCLSIEGDSNYCLTVTRSGNPALWDRNRGQLKYVGRWIKNSNYRDYDYYNSSNQPWFEW